MEDELKRIAVENVKNRNRSGIISVITGVAALSFFIMALSSDFQNYYWIAATIITFVVGFYIAFQYEGKVIGKKTAVDYEVERLKSLYPEEKLELPKLDESELKLKEMIRRSNRDDMV